MTHMRFIHGIAHGKHIGKRMGILSESNNIMPSCQKLRLKHSERKHAIA